MNQTDLIQSILAAERQAQAMTDDAREQSRNLDASIEEEIQAMRERYQRGAEDYLKRLEKSEQAKRERQLREIDLSTEKRLRQMEKIYQEKKEDWAEEIFQRITGKAGG